MSRYRFGHRSTLKRAGLARREDAQRLHDAGRYAGAAYLAGYYVECQLKVALMELAGVEHLRDLEAWIRSRDVDPDKALHNLELLSTLHPAVRRLLQGPGDVELTRARAECNRWTVAQRYDPATLDKESSQRRLDSVDRYSRFILNNT